MKIHELKTWPVYFDAVGNGAKRFELRRNDRGFAIGDVLHLREWEPLQYRYTGRELEARVTFIVYGPAHGVTEGHACMSIEVTDARVVPR